MVSFLQVSESKIMRAFFSPPYVQHAPSISSFLIGSPQWYLMRSTIRGVPYYAIFAIPPFFFSVLCPNVFPSTLFSNTFTLCSSLSMRDQVSYPCKTTREIAGSSLYRVIHKSLRDFRTRLHNNQDRHGRKEHINR